MRVEKESFIVGWAELWRGGWMFLVIGKPLLAPIWPSLVRIEE